MDPLTAKILIFVMVLTRVSAFLASSPIFSWQGLPVRVKIGIAFFISILLGMGIPTPQSEYELSGVLAAILLVNEAIYGVALGIICNLLFSTVRMFGIIAEAQMGLNMSEIFDPTTGETAQPLSMIVDMCFILIFLWAQGHHMLLIVLSKSYGAYPLGTVPGIAEMLEGIVAAGSTMLAESLKMAAPIMAAFILMLVVLAIFARIAPEMDILFLSMPIRVAIGLIMMAIFIPYTKSFVKEMSIWMTKLLPI